METTIISFEADGPAYLAALQTGEVIETDEETFYYWLEVLPPVRMTGSHFWFAEGAERITHYWYKGGRYFAQLTNEVNRC